MLDFGFWCQKWDKGEKNQHLLFIYLFKRIPHLLRHYRPISRWSLKCGYQTLVTDICNGDRIFYHLILVIKYWVANLSTFLNQSLVPLTIHQLIVDKKNLLNSLFLLPIKAETTYYIFSDSITAYETYKAIKPKPWRSMLIKIIFIWWLIKFYLID